jgi:hypothetical protein
MKAMRFHVVTFPVALVGILSGTVRRARWY